MTTVDLDFGPDILRSFLSKEGGVRCFNDWIQRMVTWNYLGYTWGQDEQVPPMAVGVDLSQADLSGLVMPGIDLTYCFLPHASFKGCDLRGARIGGDVTGVDFTDAQVEGLILECCGYAQGSPPIGLPDDLLDQCRADDPEVPIEASTIFHTRLEVRGRLIMPS